MFYRRSNGELMWENWGKCGVHWSCKYLNPRGGSGQYHILADPQKWGSGKDCELWEYMMVGQNNWRTFNDYFVQAYRCYQIHKHQQPLPIDMALWETMRRKKTSRRWHWMQYKTLQMWQWKTMKKLQTLQAWTWRSHRDYPSTIWYLGSIQESTYTIVPDELQ